jgi:hypothetical protein
VLFVVLFFVLFFVFFGEKKILKNLKIRNLHFQVLSRKRGDKGAKKFVHDNKIEHSHSDVQGKIKLCITVSK